MAALAHQFTGLISPLHGSFSADNLPAMMAMMPDNEMSPVMLLGPKRAISGPMEPPRSNRIIADNWRGLYGSDLFSSIWRLVAMPVAIESFPGPSNHEFLRKYRDLRGF